MGKSKYRDDFPLLVEMHLKQGLIEADVAKKLGVSVSTFEQYKLKYPELLEAIKRGKAPVDFEIEEALRKRALGYTYTEKKTVTKILPDGEGTVAEVHSIVKHVPPDVTACIFWSKNRNPQRWRDTKAVELTGKDGKDIYSAVVVLPPSDPIPE